MYTTKMSEKANVIESATYLLRDLGDALKVFSRLNNFGQHSEVVLALTLAADNIAEELNTSMKGNDKDVS